MLKFVFSEVIIKERCVSVEQIDWKMVVLSDSHVISPQKLRSSVVISQIPSLPTFHTTLAQDEWRIGTGRLLE